MVVFRTSSDPFSEVRRLQSEVNRIFQQSASAGLGGFPYLNVHANQDAVTVTGELPGVSQEDLDVSVHKDTLTIRGERKGMSDEEADGYHRRERRTGRFVRTISLPFAVDPDHVDAEMRDGILHVMLKRPESDKPRRINVKSG